MCAVSPLPEQNAAVRVNEALIAQAREDLSAHAHPAASAAAVSSSSPSSHAHHLTGSHDNHQRLYHSACVLPNDIATGIPDPRLGAQFQQYPLAEYNRFDSKLRSFTGPGTEPRLKPAAYLARKGKNKTALDVARRHDLVKNITQNRSISNHNHGLPFVAKHTNNLVSC